MDFTDSSYDSQSSTDCIEVDVCNILTTAIDMTSLAPLIHYERRYSFTDRNMDFDEDSLSLGYEKLTYIPRSIVDHFGEHIKLLDISHNKISNLDFLVYFKRLNSFVADSNLITENVVLPSLPKLTLLWLNHCKISKLYPWIKTLHQSCPNLKHLSLMGNAAAPSYFNGGTFYEYLQYRLYVISLFQSLVHLDDRSVTADQISEANRLYKRPILERMVIYTSKEFPMPVALDQNSVTLSLQKRFKSLFNVSQSNSTKAGTSRNYLI